MEHNYTWTAVPGKAREAGIYHITWTDNSTTPATEIVSADMQIIGPEDAIQTALTLAAVQLRKENAALFPEEVIQPTEEELRKMMEGNING